MTKRPFTSLRGKIHVKHGFSFKGEHFKDSGAYVVLTPGNFYEEGGFRRNETKDKRYSETFPKEYLLKKGDIVVAMTEQAEGLLGSMAKIPSSDLFLHNQRLGLVTALTSEVNVDFLYHLFKTKSVREQIRRSASGSKVKHTSPERIYGVHAPLPLPHEQTAIAKTLSILDAKIDLNHQINVELEGIAKLLYDYWFVQFDFPISAAQAAAMGKSKLKGKPYRSSGGEMTYSKALKREIPKSWDSKSLVELVTVTKETVIPSDSPDRRFKLFSIPVFDATGAYSLDLGSEIGSNKFVVTESDILVSKLNPWFSRVIYTETNIDAVCSTEFVVWQTTDSCVKTFLYMTARSSEFISFCTQSATGTSNSHKRVNPDVMMSHMVAWDQNVVEDFGDRVTPLLLARQSYLLQNKQLIELRDWLLPMLMNGQVTIG